LVYLKKQPSGEVTINMRNKKSIPVLAALVFLATLITAIGSSAQSADSARPVQVPQGQKQKIQGVVSVRSGDAFKSPRSSG
jgi:hypothetical protein